jgi:high-affinity iron transporter
LLGKVVNQNEFIEQVTFSKQVSKLLRQLPHHPRQAALITQSQKLAQLIQQKSAAERINQLAQQLRHDIVNTYQLSVAPQSPPEITQAPALFQQFCASCHGVEGYGDGDDGVNLLPRPSDFHDLAHMNQINVYTLYSTITLGINGTGMNAYPQLSDEQRWALAFYVSTLRESKAHLDRGHTLWEQRNFRGPAPDLTSLTNLNCNEIVNQYGEPTKAVFAYLRASPSALNNETRKTALSIKTQLNQALEHYLNNNINAAERLALSAYFEGFEPMEASLNNFNPELRQDIEQEMLVVRELISKQASIAELTTQVAQTNVLLEHADELLRSGKQSIRNAYTGTALILLRNGISLVLLLALLLAIAKRHENFSSRYIHSGWIGAALLAGLTLATIQIAGITRTILVANMGLLAAIMLAYLSICLYRQAHTQTINAQKFAWLSLLIAADLTYRKILGNAPSYQVLWEQSYDDLKTAVWAGLASGALILLALGWIILRLSMLLPRKYFYISISLLIGAAAITLTFRSITLLQAANFL